MKHTIKNLLKDEAGSQLVEFAGSFIFLWLVVLLGLWLLQTAQTRQHAYAIVQAAGHTLAVHGPNGCGEANAHAQHLANAYSIRLVGTPSCRTIDSSLNLLELTVEVEVPIMELPFDLHKSATSFKPIQVRTVVRDESKLSN